MASTFILSTILLISITALNTAAVTAVPEHEYSSLLSALRNRGYHVFANAITTTDLYYDIITGGNFTFFAPIDSVLYTLDMSMSAADYTTTMRFHVVPHRLSFYDLRTLPYGLTSFPTMLTDHEIHIVNPLALPLPIIVEGVYIDVPDLYSDTHIAVHGLESIIDFRSKNDTTNSTSIAEVLAPALAPTDGHRETYVPSPQVAVPVSALPPHSSVVTGIDAVASPMSVPMTSFTPSSVLSPAQQHSQPETKSESIMQWRKSPETRSDTIIQSHKSPETKSDSVIQSHQSQRTYFESITQPLEEHESVAMSSRFIPQAIHHVSLATKSTGDSTEEFTPVDDTTIDCHVADDDDGEQMKIANIRRGDHYMRELYTPREMTCAHEYMETSG